MGTRHVHVQHFTVVSSKLFEDVLAKIDAVIGHPDMSTFAREVADAKTFADLDSKVERLLTAAAA